MRETKTVNSMKKVLVVGIGSILRGDDGVGTMVIDGLEKEALPEYVSLERGDLSGIDLLKYFPDFEKVIIVDAADMKEAPGTIKVFQSAVIKKSDFNDCVSTHGMALLETLTLAEKLDIPSEITIIGIQPQDVSFRLGLSDTVEKTIPSVIEKVKQVLGQDPF